MSVTTATPTSVQVQVRDFTEKEMERYFSKAPRWPLPVAIVGVLFVLFGLSNGQATCSGLGLVMALAGGLTFAYFMTASKPTDAEYDAWVENKLSALEPRAREKLGLVDESQIISPRMRVDGFVLPTLASLITYGDVRMKVGKDKYARFSINTVKYFYPTEHNLGAYSDFVNALKQKDRTERTEEFFYTDIVGATTKDSIEEVVLDKAKKGKDGKPLSRRGTIKSFKLIASSGDDTGVTIGFHTDDDTILERTSSTVDQTVGSLRTLLKDRKGGMQQAQMQQQQQASQMQQQMQQQMLEQMRSMQEHMMRMQQQQQAGGAAPNSTPSDTTPPETSSQG
jgi:hypothetical protein